MNRERTLPVPFELHLDAVALRRAGQLEIAVADLYSRMRLPVTGYVYQLTRSTQDAEDIVQVAFLRLWDELQQDREIKNIRSWIFRVVHNLAVDYGRRAGVMRAHAQQEQREPPRTDGASPESAAIMRQEIDLALSGLTERESRALMLRAEGLRYQEIAEVLGITASAVSVCLVRGLKKFEQKQRRTP
jgi:RNA polymerase sigma-70 factor (ECF subfamily)